MQTRILLSCIHFFKAFEKRERAFVCAFFLSLVHRASKMSVVFCPSFLLFFSLFFRLKWWDDDDDALGFRTQPTPRERCAFKNVPSSLEWPFSSPVRLFWKRRWFVTSSRIPFLYYILCSVMMLRAIMAKCSFLFFVSFMNLGFLKIAFFFHFLFTFSRAHLKRAFARAYNITFFFACARARAR